MTRWLSLLLLGLAAWGALPIGQAHAQAPVALYCYQGPTNPQWAPCNSTNPLQVSASVTASVTGFRPTNYGTPISVTTGGVTGTLPTNTGEVVATNVGTTNGAYCALGGSATTSSQYIAPNGGWFAFAISGDTQLTCITSTSTTTVNMAGGSGLPTGTGGGGGGSGGGGLSVVDGATFTASTSSFTPGGGEYASSPTTCADGKQCTFAITTNRALTVDTPTSNNNLYSILSSINTNIQAGVGATGSSVPSAAIYPGYNVGGNLVGAVGDPCQTVVHTYTPISTTSSAKILTGTSAKKTYVCSLFLFDGTAENFSVIEGTGSACGTNAVAVIGAATAAAGMVQAANQGFVLNGGGYAAAATSVNADDLCLIKSTSGQLSGVLVSVQQ